MHTGEWLHFHRPEAVIQATGLDQVSDKLSQVVAAVEGRGYYACGFLAYEAAPAFDPVLPGRSVAPLPLLWFGIYRRPAVLRELPVLLGIGREVPKDREEGERLDWRPAISPGEYARAVTHIKDAIARGDTYQVNYTFPLQAAYSGDPWHLFRRMARAQRARFAAYLDLGRHVVCSASPELFFRLEGDRLTARPMKGTAPRGRTWAEDQAQANWLHRSAKNRAENVMIVDMIRNDMGRVARFGTVSVPSLFDVERYPTVLQMTSTVTSRTDAPLEEVVAALFPCASITGAPKVRTMQIIADLEPHPRGVYTGCIGYLAPGRQAQFSVAIRTVVVDRERATATYGVGGGIVWDSEVAAEYEECRIKAGVLTAALPDFELLETMRWTPDGSYWLLERHLQRLAASAAYFDVPLDLDQVQRLLAAQAETLPTTSHKVRLLVGLDGVVRLQATPLDPEPTRGVPRVRLTAAPVDSGDPFLYHKTTHRAVYRTALAARPGFDDVLLYNERGELTESTVANLVVALDGELVTPPVSCGLLAGTYRGWLLDQGRVRERVVRVSDLERCRRLILVNSVRGWREVVLADGTDPQH